MTANTLNAVTFHYDPTGGDDCSALVFLKDGNVLDALYGEAADYANSILQQGELPVVEENTISSRIESALQSTGRTLREYNVDVFASPEEATDIVMNIIRPYLRAQELESACPPNEPTNGMIIAALETSLEVRKEYGVDNVQPDMPGKLPSYMCKRVWQAMLNAWRTGYTGIEGQ